MALPNFLLIGAAKAGTTSLHQLLGQHPEIFMSRFKEPGFFVFEGTEGRFPRVMHRRLVTDIATYEALFKNAAGARIVGESSTHYLDFASPEVIGRINDRLAEVRLLAVLRQPVDQAYSLFINWQRDERISAVDFREKFLADMATFNKLAWDFRGEQAVVKSYHERLRLYLDAFDATRLKVMLYDDFIADPQAFLAEIYRFLGVDPDFRNDCSVRANQGRLYRFSAVAAIMNRPNPIRWLARRLVPDDTRAVVNEALSKRLSKPAPNLDPALRAELTGLLADEIANLERLIDRDLTAWRNRSKN